MPLRKCPESQKEDWKSARSTQLRQPRRLRISKRGLKVFFILYGYKGGTLHENLKKRIERRWSMQLPAVAVALESQKEDWKVCSQATCRKRALRLNLKKRIESQ